MNSTSDNASIPSCESHTGGGLIIGCGEWGFRDLPMEEHFRIAAALGFHYLEFGIGGGRAGRLSEAPGAEEIRAFKVLRDRYGMASPFCCLENDFTLADAAAHRAMVDRVLSQISAAADCGATHVRLFAGFTPANQMTEPIWERLIDALRRCQARTKPLGIQIALETHGAIHTDGDGAAIHVPTITTDRQELAKLIGLLPEGIGFNYDPGNIKAAGEDKRLNLDLLAGRINYCHMKDWKRQGRGWAACAIGDDDLDYRPLLMGMKFAGVHLIEYEPVEDVIQGIQRSLDHLSRIAPGFRFK